MTGRPLLTALRADTPSARRLLRQALATSKGDVRIAAAALGVSFQSLYNIPAARKIILAKGQGKAGASRKGVIARGFSVTADRVKKN